MAAPAAVDELGTLQQQLQSELASLARRECERAPAYRKTLAHWLGRETPTEDLIGPAATKFAVLLSDRARYRRITGESHPTLPPVPDPIARLPASDRLDELLTTLTKQPTGETSLEIGLEYAAIQQETAETAPGQVYSPRAVAEALVAWAVPETGSPRVLDPASGPGVFLAAAAEHLEPHAPSELIGIDLDPIALRIAALRTAAAASTSPAWPTTRTQSFFDTEPTALGLVDAVIGNPPYVRAEQLDTTPVRTHLAAFGPDGDTPYLDGEFRLSKRSDAYVYFVTHATRFLRPGGRLAVILPRKWLTSQYGENFRQFLHDHYNITAIVSIDTKLFTGAMIDTCLLLAERTPNPSDRSTSPLQFIRVPSVAAARTAIDRLSNPPAGLDGHRITRAQHRLVTATKPDRYLTAPEPVLDLFESDRFAELAEFATVARGVMTGANQFFFVGRDTASAQQIADRFLRPAVKSIRGTSTRSLTPADIDRYLIDIQSYVAETAPPDTASLIETLERDGYRALAAYIEHAERNEWHTGQTCQRRALWCNLGELSPPDAFVPKLLRERRFIIQNTAAAVAGNAIDCLTVHEDFDPDLLTAVLNSTLATVAMELYGRNEAGMLQLMTYETAALPIPDVREFSRSDRTAIRDAAITDDRIAIQDQAMLDRSILTALDAPLSLDRLYELQETLLADRVDPTPHTASSDD